MVRGKKKPKGFGVPMDNISQYNHWVTYSSTLWLIEYFYNQIIWNFAIWELEPSTINIEDTKELFYAMEPLYAWAKDGDRLKRALFEE